MVINKDSLVEKRDVLLFDILDTQKAILDKISRLLEEVNKLPCESKEKVIEPKIEPIKKIDTKKKTKKG